MQHYVKFVKDIVLKSCFEQNTNLLQYKRMNQLEFWHFYKCYWFNLIPDPIVERLMSQCHILARREKRFYFYDYSYKKIGRSSFINRSKYIVELIPFEWIHLNEHLFGIKIKNLVSNFLKLSWNNLIWFSNAPGVFYCFFSVTVLVILIVGTNLSYMLFHFMCNFNGAG